MSKSKEELDIKVIKMKCVKRQETVMKRLSDLFPKNSFNFSNIPFCLLNETGI